MESTPGDHGLATGGRVPGAAAARDRSAFEDAFLRLLERRTALYTMGDSTSVPTHVAADILRSICFVLGIDPDSPEIPEHLFAVDLEQHFRRRSEAIAQEVAAAERLWRDVCLTMPMIPNIALRDTLAGIGGFFKQYDHRLMAHDIPCSIDYPLCQPVDEALLGIDYIAEYLRRLMIEAGFLRRFDVGACERVLSSASPDHIGLLINLYEPVAANAVGLALVGKDPAALVIGNAERDAIAARLGAVGGVARERALSAAAGALCERLGMTGEGEQAYLHALLPELLPRIEVGLAHGSLRGVFVG